MLSKFLETQLQRLRLCHLKFTAKIEFYKTIVSKIRWSIPAHRVPPAFSLRWHPLQFPLKEGEGMESLREGDGYVGNMDAGVAK